LRIQQKNYDGLSAFLDRRRMNGQRQPLHTFVDAIPGVDVVRAAELTAEIGDIQDSRQPTSWCGTPALFRSSPAPAARARYYKSTQGDRSLRNIFMPLAIQQLVVHRGTTGPRNPGFLEYFHRKMAEGKTKKQAFVCIMRRPVNIVYGILKHKTPYHLPEKTNCG